MAPAATEATLNYSPAAPPGGSLYFYFDEKEAPEGKPRRTDTDEPHKVPIHDLRQAQLQPSLATNGFQLVKLPLPAIDWQDKASVEAGLYPAVEKCLREHIPGISRVHCFDYTRRCGSVGDDPGGVDKLGRRVPLSKIHVDYTTKSGPGRLEQLLPEEAAQLSKHPFAVIQLWFPLKPVDESPLTLCDAATVSPAEELVPIELHFPGGRVGHNYMLRHSDKHKWYYAKRMEPGEAFLFCCYHSGTDRARWTPHTAFKDPATPPDAPPRESVEARAYIFWTDKPEQAPVMEL